jgi:integrase
VKTVRRTLANGDVKAYHYDRAAARQRQYVATQRAFLRTLIEGYVKSPEFNRLAENTRYQKRQYLTIIEDELGWMSRAELEAKSARAEFYELRNKFQATPARADMMMAHLRALLAWADDQGHIEDNRAIGLKHLRDAKAASRSGCIWADALFDRLLAEAKPEFGRLLRFAKFTGCRVGDLCALTWGQFDGEWLVYKPQKTARKTGAVVHLPLFALTPLRELMASLPRGGKDDPLLTTETGIAWTQANISKQLGQAMLDAGIDDDLHFHDLRGTLDTLLQEARCTEVEAAVIMGHSFGEKVKMGRAYIARTRNLSMNAYTTLDRYLSGGAPVLQLVKSA